MVTAKAFLVIFGFIVVDSISERKPPVGIQWNYVKPGELLHSLDSLISGHQHIGSIGPVERKISRNLYEKPRKEVIKKDNGVQNILKLQRRIDDDDSTSHETTYNYDEAYDAFVRKYFDDSAASALSASSSSENDDATVQYSEEETSSNENDEPAIEETKRHSKTEKCRNVVRNRSNCVICKNTHNGETSESCSFNKETAPKSFAFERENKYRKHLERSLDSTGASSEEKSSSPSTKEAIARSDSAITKCEEKTMRHKVCYHCESPKGETVKCYGVADSNIGSNNTNNKNVQKSHQRIYKRTIRYSYEKAPPPKIITPTISQKKTVLPHGMPGDDVGFF